MIGNRFQQIGQVLQTAMGMAITTTGGNRRKSRLGPRLRGHGRLLSHFPKTFFSSSVPRAAGSVLIFFSSSPSIVKSPSTALVVT